MGNKTPVHLAHGKRAELIAQKFLTAQGLKPVDKNFSTKSGEIDLIMADGKCIVFVEVRYRSRTDFGLPEESVMKSKQQKIIKAAQQYLIQKRLLDRCECRFDIVAIHGTIPNHHINWIRHAFLA